MIKLDSIIVVLVVVLIGCQSKKKEIKDNIQDVSINESFKRVVKGNVLISDEFPKIEITVDKEFDYIGSFDFEIIASSDEYSLDMQGKPVAAGERFVFASTDENQSVNKLFIVQFEGFLPENDLIFNYDFSNAEYIGKNKYRHNTWFYDSKIALQENPNGEGAKTRDFLQGKGLLLEYQFMMSRFVGLASKDRKREIIIFYHEMLNKATGYSLDEYENLNGNEEANSILKAFIKRSRESFKITKG